MDHGFYIGRIRMFWVGPIRTKKSLSCGNENLNLIFIIYKHKQSVYLTFQLLIKWNHHTVNMQSFKWQIVWNSGTKISPQISFKNFIIAQRDLFYFERMILLMSNLIFQASARLCLEKYAYNQVITLLHGDKPFIINRCRNHDISFYSTWD